VTTRKRPKSSKRSPLAQDGEVPGRGGSAAKSAVSGDEPARLELELAPDDLIDDAALRRAVVSRCQISEPEIAGLAIERRGIDARHGKVRMPVRLALYRRTPAPVVTWQAPEFAQVGAGPVGIVGMGPAGLFCAYRLAQLGIGSSIFERGQDVRARRSDLAALNTRGELNSESNYCFGEGGAGTYSDGKLYTRSTKRGPVRELLEILVAHGAPPEILVDTHPHVGTNRLPQVIASIREHLRLAGVGIHFSTRVDRLRRRGNSPSVAGLCLANGETPDFAHVVVATGHSAPDVLAWLQEAGVDLQAKPFAAGVRIEHPQVLIDRLQYGKYAGHPVLGAASYHLVHEVEGRSVHSFCMCPGGVIVPSTTQSGHQVVNGMSPYQRRGRFANSGFVVQILGEHLQAAGYNPNDPRAGLRYQGELETRAFQAGGGAYVAPAQRIEDMLENRASRDVVPTSYHPGLHATSLEEVLRELYAPIREALRRCELKMPGFARGEAVAIGVESRTSSPVQIPRDGQTLEARGCAGLYVCGEGAGFAGGIVSAALDGFRVAEAIARARNMPVEPLLPRQHRVGGAGF
jgi:uncharacterized FAD-dependent dehydrogenase